ncbi:hypothetical protein CY34DRAFT_19446 [Suillus luteus UH-Slu-Lm8-n1]|uniref:RNA helicase n=1 Tax=Suillus luteus UH-Slu-Lm8-n1 TaxID=930992 RepID=A0A0D0A191_9AGAM|nr:hypothetical protein CY34DRAFT_19446 [Suillus luteus UH-Slu-Lm8-n1]
MSISALDALENLPTDFTNMLSTIQFQQVLEAFAHLDFVSKGTKHPKLFQLKALVSLLAGRNVILRAATGSGKTLHGFTIASLQQDGYHGYTSEVKEFEEYGIRSIAINHDTPHDKTIWSHVSKGSFRNLLVAPEQFFPEDGHIPRLALENFFLCVEAARIHCPC